MLLDVPTLMRTGAAHLPDNLVAPAAIRALQDLPRWLPACSQIGGFELRLEAEAPRVDFSACVRACDGGREVVRRWLDERSAPATVSCDAEPILSFFRQWTLPDTSLHDGVPAVWIEFDVDPAGEQAPRPFAIFTLTAPWERDGSWGRRREETVVVDGIAALAGGADTALLRDCIRLLPPPAGVLHAAVRPREGGSDVRLIVSSPWQEIPAYLERLGAPIDGGAFADLLAELCSETLYHSFHIDLGAGVGRRVGIEFFFPTPPAQDHRWLLLFERLEHAGICVPLKRERLAAWPGVSAVSSVAAPANIARELLVKIVADGSVVRGKAYLPFYVTPTEVDRTPAQAR